MSESALPVPVEQFSQLGLSPWLLGNLELIGYEHPTPIQSEFIAAVLSGSDAVGQAKTGTGKTAAFLIPILERLRAHPVRGVAALILAPTRELAEQIRLEAIRLIQQERIATVALCGGHPMKPQLDALARGATLVVGTPGRVLDHIARRSLDLRHLRNIVLDEADRMLDIGFRPDIEKIFRHCPQERQTFLLSATVPPDVRRLVTRYLKHPISIDLSPSKVVVETIRQYYVTAESEQKLELLRRIIDRDQPDSCIIFTRTKRKADAVCRQLAHTHVSVGAMHGDLDQRQRDRILLKFRQKQVRFLVATDVVGRGIDVSGISHIINYDIPENPENYVHRVGRTARMGTEGVAYTFVTREQGKELLAIEVAINQLIERHIVDGFAAVPLGATATAAAPVAVRAAPPAVSTPTSPLRSGIVRRTRRR